MEHIKKLAPLFTAGIFFIAFIALIVGFVYFSSNSMVSSLRMDISRLESDINNLKTGQAKIEQRMDGLESKLDLLIEGLKISPKKIILF